MICISDYIRVNIAKRVGDGWNGKGEYHHYMWVVIDKTYPEAEARAKVKELEEKFPAPEYSLHVTMERHFGTELKWLKEDE